MQLQQWIKTTITGETNNTHSYIRGVGGMCKVEWLAVTLLIGNDISQSL